MASRKSSRVSLACSRRSGRSGASASEKLTWIEWVRAGVAIRTGGTSSGWRRASRTAEAKLSYVVAVVSNVPRSEL